ITDAEIPKEASPHECVEIILPLLLRNEIVHFLGFGNGSALTLFLLNFRPVSPAELRMLGKCPLTPEEAALVLAGLGYKRGIYIYY
ncbi:hypothetical protein RJ639_017830, partial [Escallonia herrerae]